MDQKVHWSWTSLSPILQLCNPTVFWIDQRCKMDLAF